MPKNIRMTITLFDGDFGVWRVTESIKEKCLYQLGEDGYRKVLRAAEEELLNQIKIDKAKKTKEEGKHG